MWWVIMSKKMCKALRLFHGTPERNLSCIINEGLKSPCAGAKKFPKGWQQEKDLIWFTDNKKLAEHHSGYYHEGKGVVIEANVEVCNPLNWNRPIGKSASDKISKNRHKLPCDIYVIENYGSPEPDDDGAGAIVKIAERCMKKSSGMGEIIRFLGYESFHEVLTPDKWLGKYVNNYAVTDEALIEIINTRVT